MVLGMTNLGTAIATTTKTCMKCETEPAVLTLASNGDGVWHYCTNCAKVSLFGTDEYEGTLAYIVRYVYPFGGVPRAHLPADALALCRS